MPRPGPVRTAVSTRLDAEEMAALDEIVASSELTVADVLRDALAAYVKSWRRKQEPPKPGRPKKETT